MIVLDIESSGLAYNCGIWQIGAIDLETKEEFLEECRIDEDDEITEEALKVIGKTIEELKDSEKQSQKQMIEKYLEWIEKKKDRLIMGANVSWDISMIQFKVIKYGLRDNFAKIHGHRGYDLQTFAQEKYFEINGKYFVKDTGVNNMSLDNVLSFCGINIKRIHVVGGEVVEEGKPHDALEDCKLEGEALMRLKLGKNFFPEYSKFPIPEYLKNDNI